MLRITLLVIFSFMFSQGGLALDEKCNKDLQIVFRNSEKLANELKDLPLKYKPLLHEVLESEQNAPLSSHQRSILRGRIRNFVISMRTVFENQTDDVISKLMETWVNKKVKAEGKVHGLINSPGYTKFSDIQDDIVHGKPWNFLNVYVNAQVPIQAFIAAYGNPTFDLSTLHLIELAIADTYDALLVREFTKRFIRNKPDIEYPGGDAGSTHLVFDVMDQRIFSVFP